ncbi:hypothetical protein ANO11243_068600 [Dothideomycetidae sp. 11243]|nr:hypothetical protein ANO11243_068600 [fungal sp. No.11243]
MFELVIAGADETSLVIGPSKDRRQRYAILEGKHRWIERGGRRVRGPHNPPRPSLRAPSFLPTGMSRMMFSRLLYPLGTILLSASLHRIVAAHFPTDMSGRASYAEHVCGSDENYPDGQTTHGALRLRAVYCAFFVPHPRPPPSSPSTPTDGSALSSIRLLACVAETRLLLFTPRL